MKNPSRSLKHHYRRSFQESKQIEKDKEKLKKEFTRAQKIITKEKEVKEYYLRNYNHSDLSLLLAKKESKDNLLKFIATFLGIFMGFTFTFMGFKLKSLIDIKNEFLSILGYGLTVLVMFLPIALIYIRKYEKNSFEKEIIKVCIKELEKTQQLRTT
ncbi:hypothetical protein [Cohnella soli]|uniref:Uncharacterized protein n=1 Tax=Cohnella soli TaxID=425005 RepID=A0ABW0HMV4_9BACL